MKSKLFVAVVSCIALFACEKDFDIDVASAPPQLIVEAYISNQNPLYSYVILSKSVDYFNPTFQGVPVKNALVTITAGQKQSNNTILWNPLSTVTLREASNPMLPPVLANGVYIDPLVFTNINNALTGTVGRFYRLDITTDNQTYTGITELKTPVALDSVNYGFPFIDDDSARTEKVRITSHYKDPDTLGNTYFYYWRNNENRNRFGWAGLFKSRAPGRDDNSNGDYIRLTHPQGITYKDTITYMLTTVDRNTHSFWDSYLSARNNNGPFATPVVLQNYMSGQNVIGCFMGLSVSEKTIIIKK